MKILFISALLPYPLHSGGQVRIYNLLKRLGKKHDITLATFLRSNEERRYISEFPFCKKVEAVYRGHAWQPYYIAKSLLSTYPLLFTTYAHQELKGWIGRELESGRYDLVHIEPSYVWSALPKVLVPTVVCEHNIEYLGYKGYAQRFTFMPIRPFLMLDVSKLAWWERKVWQEATRIITVSSEDRDVIAKEVTGEKIDVVPNGVDLKEFVFKPKKPNSSPVFLFVGNFSWLQNRDAVKYLVREIWPMLRRRLPKSQLRIVGRQAPSDLREMIRKSNARLLDGVEDITSQYSNADMLIAPIRIGSGSRYKILEAMACGLPVITTRVGAGGLEVEIGRDMVLAETPEDFLLETQTLLSNQNLRTSIVKSARKVIEKSYSWEIIARQLERVWEKTCGK